MDTVDNRAKGLIREFGSAAPEETDPVGRALDALMNLIQLQAGCIESLTTRVDDLQARVTAAENFTGSEIVKLGKRIRLVEESAPAPGATFKTVTGSVVDFGADKKEGE